MREIAIGSTWREDYDYGPRKGPRIVKVCATAGDKVYIESLETGRKTWASAARFGRKRGYLPAEVS